MSDGRLTSKLINKLIGKLGAEPTDLLTEAGDKAQAEAAARP